MSTVQDKVFVDNLQVILDLVQLLKYNVDSFKGNDIHKTVSKQKDMRPDCVLLLGALNGFLIRLKDKCDPKTFRELMRAMKRERLHDLSILMNEMFEVDNVETVTEVIRELKLEAKEIEIEVEVVVQAPEPDLAAVAIAPFSEEHNLASLEEFHKQIWDAHHKYMQADNAIDDSIWAAIKHDTD